MLFPFSEKTKQKIEFRGSFSKRWKRWREDRENLSKYFQASELSWRRASCHTGLSLQAKLCRWSRQLRLQSFTKQSRWRNNEPRDSLGPHGFLCPAYFLYWIHAPPQHPLSLWFSVIFKVFAFLMPGSLYSTSPSQLCPPATHLVWWTRMDRGGWVRPVWGGTVWLWRVVFKLPNRPGY